MSDMDCFSDIDDRSALSNVVIYDQNLSDNVLCSLSLDKEAVKKVLKGLVVKSPRKRKNIWEVSCHFGMKKRKLKRKLNELEATVCEKDGGEKAKVEKEKAPEICKRKWKKTGKEMTDLGQFYRSYELRSCAPKVELQPMSKNENGVGESKQAEASKLLVSTEEVSSFNLRSTRVCVTSTNCGEKMKIKKKKQKTNNRKKEKKSAIYNQVNNVAGEKYDVANKKGVSRVQEEQCGIVVEQEVVLKKEQDVHLPQEQVSTAANEQDKTVTHKQVIMTKEQGVHVIQEQNMTVMRKQLDATTRKDVISKKPIVSATKEQSVLMAEQKDIVIEEQGVTQTDKQVVLDNYPPIDDDDDDDVEDKQSATYEAEINIADQPENAITDKPEFNATGEPEVAVAVGPEVAITAEPEVTVANDEDINIKDQLDMSLKSKLQMINLNKMDTGLTLELEKTAEETALTEMEESESQEKINLIEETSASSKLIGCNLSLRSCKVNMITNSLPEKEICNKSRKRSENVVELKINREKCAAAEEYKSESKTNSTKKEINNNNEADGYRQQPTNEIAIALTTATATTCPPNPEQCARETVFDADLQPSIRSYSIFVTLETKFMKVVHQIERENGLQVIENNVDKSIVPYFFRKRQSRRKSAEKKGLQQNTAGEKRTGGKSPQKEPSPKHQVVHFRYYERRLKDGGKNFRLVICESKTRKKKRVPKKLKKNEAPTDVAPDALESELTLIDFDYLLKQGEIEQKLFDER